MKWVVLFLGLVGAGVAQGLLPVVEWAGKSPLPLLGSLVIYYALIHSRMVMLTVGSLAGLVQDSLSLMPLGYSSLCFCLIALVIDAYRELLIIDLWTTHAFLGAAANGVTVVMMYLFLLNDGLGGFSFLFILSKIFGSILLGGLTAPVVFAVMHGLDRMVGVFPSVREDLW